MVEVVDPICFWKKSICMIFDCGVFYQPKWEISSLVKKNNHVKGKWFTGNWVLVFALFSETLMPEIHNLLKN